ncbi:hypothetical protein RRG08_051637 [Elysia crispata]|uniref:Uncharacterized protein n=1 Tax=Elysia crispata TaxID=231223 RepID=A0AAE1A2G4_9GAST|nr:hypothetical protein RRG08_051637 [Elysia crispata]
MHGLSLYNFLDSFLFRKNEFLRPWLIFPKDLQRFTSSVLGQADTGELGLAAISQIMSSAHDGSRGRDRKPESWEDSSEEVLVGFPALRSSWAGYKIDQFCCQKPLLAGSDI